MAQQHSRPDLVHGVTQLPQLIDATPGLNEGMVPCTNRPHASRLVSACMPPSIPFRLGDGLDEESTRERVRPNKLHWSQSYT